MSQASVPKHGALRCAALCRGAKLSTLAAVQDPRVKALFLIDPVDTTVYAPLSALLPSRKPSKALGLSCRTSSLTLAAPHHALHGASQFLQCSALLPSSRQATRVPRKETS